MGGRGRGCVVEEKSVAKGGKLTRRDIKVAETHALGHAKRFAQAQGVDLVRELGLEFLRMHISSAVERQKTGAVRTG